MRGKLVLVALIFVLCAIGTLAETVALVNFETKPGLPPMPPPVWPRQVKLTHVPNKNHIIVIAHPQCGCTQATLQQLAKVTDAAVSVLVYRPDSRSDWGKTPIWQQVRLIQGASVEWDDGGKTARAFGSSTSGSILLYSPDGRLLFHGGITQSRGHAGENRGLSELKLALHTGLPSSFATPVFGCSLLNTGTRT